MKKININWLLMGTFAYVSAAIFASSVFTLGVMLMFPTVPPSELTLNPQTAVIFQVGEALIGFSVALSVAYWVCAKTMRQHPTTLWAFAAALTCYGIISIYLHATPLLSADALGNLIAPWIVALLAQKWVMGTQR